ncbi:MAG: response regulator [Bacilli bacterium]|nr:response regulator [Bacilli bacterium]
MKNTVIVVDDSEMIRNIMKKALNDEYNVIEASDGRMAIEEVKKNKDNTCCILLDLKMPRYDGFVVLEYFKTYNLEGKIPIFIISGDDTKDTIDKAFTYNVIDMLSKPFSPENIKDAVKKAINLSKN